MSEQPYAFRYRNWRGEVADRRVIPERVAFATSQWHPGPAQWFLVARDLDRDGAVRHFAMADILGPATGDREERPVIRAELHDRITFRLRLAEAALVELAQVVHAIQRAPSEEPDGNEELCCGHPDKPCQGCEESAPDREKPPQKCPCDYPDCDCDDSTGPCRQAIEAGYHFGSLKYWFEPKQCEKPAPLVEQIAQRLAQETIGRSMDRIDQARINHLIVCVHKADPLNPAVCSRCGERLNVTRQGGF
jgi:hypothetical protein